MPTYNCHHHQHFDEGEGGEGKCIEGCIDEVYRHGKMIWNRNEERKNKEMKIK